MRRATSLSLLVVGIWLASSGGALHAAVIDWINPAGGTYSDGANWQGGKAPSAADNAVFSLKGPLTTTLSASSNARRVIATTGDTTIDLGGHELTTQSDTQFDWGFEVFSGATVTLKNGTFTNLGGETNGVTNRGTLNVTTKATLNDANTIRSTGKLSVTDGGVVSAHDTQINSAAAIDGAGSKLTGFYVNFDNNAQATVQNSGVIDASVVFLDSSSSPTSHTEVTVTGAGSKILGSIAIQVGYFGHGSVTVEQQGSAHAGTTEIGSFSDSIGAVVVRDPGSSWINDSALWVGAGGQGTLTVENGATAAAGNAYVGHGDDATGNVSVDGAGSKWNVATLSLERARLSVTNGGFVQANASTLGGHSDTLSTAIVDGAGSTWTNSSQLIVGGAGPGALTVSNGGQVLGIVKPRPTIWILGQSFDGSVVVTDPGSKLVTNAPLHLGITAAGSLTVQNGATASTLSAQIGRFEGASGIVTVTGASSSWTTTGDVYVGGDNLGAGGSGELEIADSGLVKVTGSATVWETGSVHLDAGTLQATTVNLSGGSLSGIGTVLGNLNNSGEVSPGNSSGTLKVQGNFTQSLDGLLKLEIGSTAADLLQVTGNAKLGGTLHLSLLGGFTPGYGTTYDLLTASKLSGAFDTLELPDLGPGHSWQFNYGADRFSVTAVPEPAGIVLGVIGGMFCLAVARRRRPKVSS